MPKAQAIDGFEAQVLKIRTCGQRTPQRSDLFCFRTANCLATGDTVKAIALKRIGFTGRGLAFQQTNLHLVNRGQVTDVPVGGQLIAGKIEFRLNALAENTAINVSTISTHNRMMRRRLLMIREIYREISDWLRIVNCCERNTETAHSLSSTCKASAGRPRGRVMSA